MKLVVILVLLIPVFCFCQDSLKELQSHSDFRDYVKECKVQPTGISKVFSDLNELKLSTLPIGEVTLQAAKYFIGTDYKAASLEMGRTEDLVIDITGFDCTTLAENAIAFAHSIKVGALNYDTFAVQLERIRYRNGILYKYPSRLHYFSDWIYDNDKKGIIMDITSSLGGVPVTFNVNFMSTHPDAYKHLKETPEFIPIIKEQESAINKREYHYIPANKIASVEEGISNGDIIAFTTSIKGLDIGHVGIAVRESDNRIHLLHASKPGTTVHITTEPLADYITKVKKHTGIIVLRPLEP